MLWKANTLFPVVCLMLAACTFGRPKPAATAEPPPPSMPPPPATGVLLEQDGELSANDLVYEQRFVDDFDVVVQAGVRVVVRVDATDLDTLLRVTAPDGTEHENDDHEGSTQVSLVEFLNPTAGTMKVRVSTYDENATGSYRLHAEAFDAAAGTPTQSTQMLAAGSRVGGTIEDGDWTALNGARSDTFTLQGGVSESVTLRLESGAFPATVTVLTPDGQSASASTDAEGHAELGFSLGASGNYTVSVGEQQPGQGGTSPWEQSARAASGWSRRANALTTAGSPRSKALRVWASGPRSPAPFPAKPRSAPASRWRPTRCP